MIVPASDIRVILSTAGSPEEGERIARALVEQRVAACVNIIPNLTSVYRWEGRIESASEVLLLIKTSAGLVERAESVLRSTHSYEIPEVLVLNPVSGHADYVDWLIRSVREPE
ncbi:MAG TPA: divalent-cation tolerance protein CutA [Acidobacteriaceae bacterium]|jgi:periplasmic divalent cation tolerance protein|nr:divalent-cation tolerance protein CutA [Acidobacteriaceae bacterium]